MNNRKIRKTIAVVCFALFGLLIIPSLDDVFVNAPIALMLQNILRVQFLTAYFLTYTIIPASVLIAGIWIYPADNRYVYNKVKRKVFGGKK